MVKPKVIVRFFVDGKPVGKGRPRFTRDGHAYTPKTTRDYEQHVCRSFREFHDTYFGDAPIMMRICAAFSVPTSFNKKNRALALSDEIRPTKKPDADNIVKAICDSLNKVAYDDDSNVVKLLVDKVYGEDPRVYVILSKWEHGLDFNNKAWEVYDGKKTIWA